jgi:hypothetical protein
MATKPRFKDPSTNTKNDFDYLSSVEKYFEESQGSISEKLENFAKYSSRQSLTRFIDRYEMFKQVLNVQGSIIECGVLLGGGLMSFAQFSSILEPINLQRKIIGIDTFSGFPNVSTRDTKGKSQFAKVGGYNANSYEDLMKCIELYDSNRFINHMPKMELVKGDATKTIPKYIKDNPHLIVSLLYLDFDLYEPTKVALENIVPRMPKGAIIGFDEINMKAWPGETEAVLETLGIKNLRIKRSSFSSVSCYAVIE